MSHIKNMAHNAMAEREGFEPSVPFEYTRFPIVLLKPLGHLSASFKNTSIIPCLSKDCQGTRNKNLAQNLKHQYIDLVPPQQLPLDQPARH